VALSGKRALASARDGNYGEATCSRCVLGTLALSRERYYPLQKEKMSREAGNSRDLDRGSDINVGEIKSILILQL
jgi:hypothetical protein